MSTEVVFNDENTDLLLSLGLTINQAKVYLVILKLEKTTAGEVAKYSKVRREDVYRILPALGKMGLIERFLGKPIKIRATPISDALTSLLSKEKRQFDDHLKGLQNTVQKLSQKDWKQPLPSEESTFILIEEKTAILAKTSELIRHSKKEVTLIADKTRIIPTLYRFSQEYKQAIKRGAQINLLFEGDKSDDLQIEKVNKLLDGMPVQIRFNPESLSHFFMFDGKEALVPTSKDSGLGESPYLFTNNNNFLGVLRNEFESNWQKAVQIN